MTKVKSCGAFLAMKEVHLHLYFPIDTTKIWFPNLFNISGEVSPSRDRTSSLPPPVSSLTLLGSHPPRSIPEDKVEEEVHGRCEDTHQFSGSKLSRERSSLTRDESLRGLNLFSPPVTNNIDESSSNSTFFPAPQIPHTPSHREQVAQSQGKPAHSLSSLFWGSTEYLPSPFSFSLRFIFFNTYQ